MKYRIGDLYAAMKYHDRALASYEIANEYNKMNHPSILLKSICINEGFDNYMTSYKSLDMLYKEGLLPALWYNKYTDHLALSTDYPKTTKVINEAIEMTPFDNSAPVMI